VIIYWYCEKLHLVWNGKSTAIRSGQRGEATDCKPPHRERRESAPGSERDADALRFGPVTSPLSEKKEWNRENIAS